MPQAGEYGMMSSIRVKARSRQEKLHAKSLINFSKMYTVEHNVKVYDFGDVAEDDIKRLKEQWKYVLLHFGQGHPSEQVAAEPVTSDKSVSGNLGYTFPVTGASPYAAATSPYNPQSYAHPQQLQMHQPAVAPVVEGEEEDDDEDDDDDKDDNEDEDDDEEEDEDEEEEEEEEDGEEED
jgi:hypothetical protein